MSGRNKPNRKGRSPRVDELRDPKTNISTENHLELTRRLIAAGKAGIHGKPGERKRKS